MSRWPRALLPLSVLCGIAVVLSATAAGLYSYTDAELSGPEQPIAFSHRLHATDLGIECLYCHSAVETSQHASVPAVSVCMGCHQWVREGPSEGSAEEIQKIHDFCKNSGPGTPCTGESIPWLRVHWMPEHVQFKHFRHVGAGIQCQECHGPVETMNRVYLTPDTVYRWPHSWGLPAKKLEMGWCVECHQERNGPTDCVVCHY